MSPTASHAARHIRHIRAHPPFELSLEGFGGGCVRHACHEQSAVGVSSLDLFLGLVCSGWASVRRHTPAVRTRTTRHQRPHKLPPPPPPPRLHVHAAMAASCFALCSAALRSFLALAWSSRVFSTTRGGGGVTSNCTSSKEHPPTTRQRYTHQSSVVRHTHICTQPQSTAKQCFRPASACVRERACVAHCSKERTSDTRCAMPVYGGNLRFVIFGLKSNAGLGVNNGARSVQHNNATYQQPAPTHELGCHNDRCVGHFNRPAAAHERTRW